VIPATALPPTEPLELALSSSRAIIQASRRESARLIVQARRRASRYRERAKERGYRAGLEQGLSESALNSAKVVESLRDLYSTTIDAAHRDLSLVAHRIVEELVEHHLRDNPELIARWIQRAIDHLKQRSGLILRYSPRYQETLHHFAPHLPVGISTSCDPTLGNNDFAIDTDVGAITFSWRELLNSLKPTPSNEGAL